MLKQLLLAQLLILPRRFQLDNADTYRGKCARRPRLTGVGIREIGNRFPFDDLLKKRTPQVHIFFFYRHLQALESCLLLLCLFNGKAALFQGHVELLPVNRLHQIIRNIKMYGLLRIFKLLIAADDNKPGSQLFFRAFFN